MVRIHHATAAKAEKLALMLTAHDDKVEGRWAERNQSIFAVDAKTALAEIEALRHITLDLEAKGVDARFDFNETRTRVTLYANATQVNERPMAPTELQTVTDGVDTFAAAPEVDEGEYDALARLAGSTPAEDGVGPDAEETALTPHQEGAIAYENGVFAADCPYEEGTDEFEAWAEGWDEAADAAEPTEEDGKVASVVADKYRALYAEAGHPDNCGDWLAFLLEGICVNDAGTNLELFEAICNLNDIDLGKYNRTTRGWQGRLRMTGRNLLARKVFNVGFLILPDTLGGKMEANAEWLATRTYKKQEAK